MKCPKPKNHSRFQAVAPGIYRDTKRADGMLYERPWINGKRTYRSLGVTNVADAKDILRARRTDQVRSEVGLADDPYEKAILTTVGEVIRRYEADGYPDKLMAKRPEVTENMERANCASLLRFWDGVLLKDVRQSMFDNYFRWRSKRVKKGATGRRSTDQELSTLANAMTWAHRCELIRYNPMPYDRQRYNAKQFVKHCRSFSPPNADVLHKAAKTLFQWPGGKSEVLGFQILVEAFTGLRTKETLKMRIDAREGAPGYITPDWSLLHVGRDKNQVNVNPFVIIHPALKELLKALFDWKAKWYPHSPWFFPSIHDDGNQPIHRNALAQALNKLGKRMEPKLRSHGMRAFYVKIRRSWGLSDPQIAAEIGHESGGKTLVDVYGSVPQNWVNGGGPKMDWLPNDDKPAWTYVGTAPRAHTGEKPEGWKPTPLPNARPDYVPVAVRTPAPNPALAGRIAKPRRQPRRNAAPDQNQGQAGAVCIAP